MRTAQGSRSAPLSWSVIFSLICRCVLSTLRDTRHSDSQLRASMQVFVDDPWLAMQGSCAQLDRMTAIAIIAWRILGVSLALSKGQIGDSISRIEARLSIEYDRDLAITIIQSRLDELMQPCIDILASETVSIRKLRAFTGKAQSIASVLHVWRPFVSRLYGALYPTDPVPHP